MFEVEVIGDITGKARPRMNTYTGIAYTPTKTKFYEYLVKKAFQDKYGGIDLIPGDIAVKVTIVAYFEVPKSTSNKKAQQMLNHLIRPTKKPDIDNITKIVLDAMNKFVIYDDTQVVELDVKKYYSKSPKIYVKVEELNYVE